MPEGMLSNLFLSVGIVTVISSILAIIMVLADATVANYGEVKVRINKQKELKVKGGKPLLSTLMGEGIFVPSACGGRGSCGLCKVKVTSDVGPYLPTELPWINKEEAKQNVRLSCQLKVKKDVEIAIPEELFNIREYTTRVTGIKDLTYDIKEVTLELVSPGEINFEAGQFVNFQVPEYELTPESVYRAYSLASSPQDKNKLELEVRLVPNGICTTYVHSYMKEGETILVNGPYGEFFLRDTHKDIIFIAGGSGMAPIKSILHDMLSRGIQRKATYFFGARSLRDLFLVDEMRAMEGKLPGFKFVPALSEPKPEDNWQGETGLITEVVKRYVANLDTNNTESYLCGSPGMIDACIAVLTEKGLKPEFIFFDKFA